MGIRSFGQMGRVNQSSGRWPGVLGSADSCPVFILIRYSKSLILKQELMVPVPGSNSGVPET